MQQSRTRILLADDHAQVRRGLRLILDAEPDLRAVAEAGDGAQAVDIAARGEADLAIVDIAMPRMTGSHAARELARRAPQVRLLMLSMYDNEQYLLEALKAGASGFMLKSVGDPRPARGLPSRDAREALPLPGRGQPIRTGVVESRVSHGSR